MIRKSWRFVRAALMLAAPLLTLPVQAAFTVNGDGTVTDSATGLMWDQCSWGQSGATCANSATVRNWPQALAVAVTANAMNSGVGYKNHNDWRLPNKNELETLADISLVSPAINTTVFLNTACCGDYWSSTNFAPLPTRAWFVSFGDGNLIANAKTLHLYVRLVRGGKLFDTFDGQAPNSPFNVVAVLGNARARVGFSAPGGNGTRVSGYTVRAYAVMNGPLGTQSNTTGAMPVGGSGLLQSQVVAGTDINAGSLSLNHTITGLDNGTAYTFTVTANGSEGDSQESVPSDQITPSPFAAPLVHPINLSTRAPVQTGDNVLIGGFIIGGSTPKKVLLRAVGPTLANYGVSGALADPTLQLFSGQTVIESNDNWQTASNAADVQATGLAPVNGLESAILTTLNPGAYTAIVSGVAGGTGVGMVEIYEIDNPDTPFINISTRARVLTADSVMIGGFIIQGNSAQTVLIRAVGPNLANYGVTGVLANPKLDLYSGQTVIASNDDWQSATNAAAIQATGLAPVSLLESAILITLQPGAYTAIVSGADGGTGVGIVEVFAQ